MSLLKSVMLMCAYISWMTYRAKTSSFFVLYKADSDINGAESSPVINKMFHKCSMKEACSFVFQDSTTAEYEMTNREEGLPKSRSTFKIWTKMRMENQPKTVVSMNEIRSCKEAKDNGVVADGIVDLSWGNGSSFKAYCDMTTDGGGWTVFQRRVDDSVSFERNWEEYVHGFGDLFGNFWLGLEAIHYLTQRQNATLRFDLINVSFANGYAKYNKFKLKNRTANFEISLGEYEGNVGDGMSMSNGMAFSTSDKDNDKYDDGSCSALYQGAWWYNQCSYVRLNSRFPAEYDDANSHVMKWTTWNEGNGTVVHSEIKLREELL